MTDETRDDAYKVIVDDLLAFLTIDDVTSPSQAASAIRVAMEMLRTAIQQANTQVQQVAALNEVILNQGRVLDAFAAVLELPDGKLYTDMIPLLQAMVANQRPPPEAPPDATIQ